MKKNHKNKLTNEQILDFIENSKKMFWANQSLDKNLEASTPVSIRIPNSLLKAFKIKCANENLHYQTEIKNLMRKSLLS